MRLVLDAAAGDAGPGANVAGAVEAVKALGIELVLVGPASVLKDELARRGIKDGDSRFEIADAPEAVSKDEDGSAAVRGKPNCSIMKACELLADAKLAGLVSPGNPGAALAASLWHLKRMPGVLRPALAALLPTRVGASLILDAGANQDCKPWHLLQFAVMGAVYSTHILKRPNPRIAMLSTGRSETKGNELVREALPLLKFSGLQFIGAIDPREALKGAAEVIVCDGFVGEIALATAEASAVAAVESLEKKSASGLFGGARARLLRVAASRQRGLDGTGSPLLGVNGVVVTCRYDAAGKNVAESLRTASVMAENNIGDLIRKSVDEVKQNLETSRVNL